MNLFLNIVVLLKVSCLIEALPKDKPPEGRIVGGQEAWPHSYPYIVSLQLSIFGLRIHYCGGSLLNKYWVLTAGHCLKVSWLYQLFPLDVVAGAHNIDYHDRMTQVRTVDKRVPHPEYEGGITEFDIGLAKVYLPFEFTSAVQAIRLPDGTVTKHNNLMILGWGALRTTVILPSMPQMLQEVKVSYISYKDCYKAMEKVDEEDSELILNKDVHICTGPLYRGVAACSGDSGGPLIEYVNLSDSDSNINDTYYDDENETLNEETSSNKPPGSFWDRLQEMLEQYISPRENIADSIDKYETVAPERTDKLIDEIDSIISSRELEDKTELVPIVIGVVSWGILPCGYKGAPTVYTNVSHYIDFIKKNIDT